MNIVEALKLKSTSVRVSNMEYADIQKWLQWDVEAGKWVVYACRFIEIPTVLIETEDEEEAVAVLFGKGP